MNRYPINPSYQPSLQPNQHFVSPQYSVRNPSHLQPRIQPNISPKSNSFFQQPQNNPLYSNSPQPMPSPQNQYGGFNQQNWNYNQPYPPNPRSNQQYPPQNFNNHHSSVSPVRQPHNPMYQTPEPSPNYYGRSQYMNPHPMQGGIFFPDPPRKKKKHNKINELIDGQNRVLQKLVQKIGGMGPTPTRPSQPKGQSPPPYMSNSYHHETNMPRNEYWEQLFQFAPQQSQGMHHSQTERAGILNNISQFHSEQNNNYYQNQRQMMAMPQTARTDGPSLNLPPIHNRGPGKFESQSSKSSKKKPTKIDLATQSEKKRPTFLEFASVAKLDDDDEEDINVTSIMNLDRSEKKSTKKLKKKKKTTAVPKKSVVIESDTDENDAEIASSNKRIPFDRDRLRMLPDKKKQTTLKTIKSINAMSRSQIVDEEE